MKRNYLILMTLMCLIVQTNAQNLLLIQENGQFGYIDTTGKKVIPCKYVNAGEFREGLAAVRLSKGLFGYINEKGEWAIQPQYDYAREFSEGLAVVFEDGIPKTIKKDNTIFFDSNSFKKMKNFIKLIEIEDVKNGKFKIYWTSEQRFWNMYSIIDTTFKIIEENGIGLSDFKVRYKKKHCDPKANDSIDIVDKCFSDIQFLYKNETKLKKNSKDFPYYKDSIYLFVNTKKIIKASYTNNFCYTAYLINNKKDSIRIFSALDFELEALDKNGKWVKLFSYPYTSCNMGENMISYYKKIAYAIQVPIFKGAYKTKLRVRLPKHHYYNQYEIKSNEFEGTINYAQLYPFDLYDY